MPSSNFVPNGNYIQSANYAPVFDKDRKASISSGESTDEEKNHVIKVLQHESKLYNFERNVLNILNQNQYKSTGTFIPKGDVRISSPIYQLNDFRKA